MNDYINNYIEINENEKNYKFKSETKNKYKDLKENEKKKYKTNEVDNIQYKNKLSLSDNEQDMELQYLEKLSKLKKENNKMIEDNKNYLQEIEKLKIELENKKRRKKL